MRILRLIAFVVGGVLALLVIAVVAIWLLVNPNDYKGRIVTEVRNTTGRDLALPGSIKLSVFPWIALEAGPASLGNPAGFPNGEFVSVQHVALRVRLLPLLHKELQIGRIEIDQLNLNLQKNAAGKGNWEDFGQRASTPAEPARSTGQGGSIFDTLAGVLITHSRVAYGALSVDDLNLDIGNIAQKSSLPMKLSFILDRGPSASALNVSAELMITLDLAAKRYGMSQLNVTGGMKPRSGDTLPFQFTTASANLDLAAQTLRAPQFTAQFANAKLSGSLLGDQLVDKPLFTGSVALEPVALRTLMAQLGSPLPATRDTQAFSRLGLKADFRYGDKSLQLQNLQAKLDDSTLRGSLAVTDLDTYASNFDLALDHIEVDRYRAPLAAAPAPQPQTAAAQPAQLPTSPLRPLDIHGSFDIGSAKFAGLTFSKLSMTMQARDGLIHLFPLKASMYGGQYAGDITYDVRGAIPQLQLNQQLTGIDMAPLLKDAMNSQRLSGHGNATTTLTGHGLDSDALLKSLTGRIALNLSDGAVEGADLSYEIGVAQALLKQQAPPATANTRRTTFDALRLSATVADGLARSDDLIAATAYLRVTGQGTANLLNKAIDIHLTATVLKAPPAAPGADLSPLTLAAIPVAVTGTANDPKVRPDLQGLLKSQLKQKAQELIKGKLNDQLKGLFGTH
jgi:AsmA protein